MTCRCGREFEKTHSRQKYCTKSCAALPQIAQPDPAEFDAKRQKLESERARKAESTRKGEILRRLQLQEIKLAEATRRLDEVRAEAVREGLVDADAQLDAALKEAQERFEREAVENADNVTANRAKAFLLAAESLIRPALTQYAFIRGLTDFDVDAMWAKMMGNPRPIVIEPERPVSAMDFQDDEDEAA